MIVNFVKLMVCILGLWSSVCMAEGGRLALVIGNSNYADVPLINPVNDATDMANKLSALGFEVIKQTNVDRQGMRMAIRDFGNRLKDVDVGLFYYAGHGVQIKGVNYLVPLRADINSADEVQDESIEAGSVLRKMETAGNKVNIVILDACRNNPFASNFRSLNRGLARMDGPVGSFIAYATSPGAVAADGDGRNGLYTQYLLEAMGQPDLSIEQVFKQVRNRVVRDTRGKQTPWESSSLMGEFVFADKGARYSSSVIAAPPVQPVTIGHVQVISNIPWASVTINNQAKGKVDADGVLNISQIQGKSAAISVSAPGYFAYARNIEIIPNQWQQVYATLKRAEKLCYVDKKVALAMQVELLGTKKKKLRPVHRQQLQSFISNALTQNQVEVLASRYKEHADYDVQAYITINVLPITQIKTSFKTVDISIVLELMDRDTGKTLSQLNKVYRKAGSSADEVFQKVLRNNMVPVMRNFLVQVCE